MGYLLHIKEQSQGVNLVSLNMKAAKGIIYITNTNSQFWQLFFISNKNKRFLHVDYCLAPKFHSYLSFFPKWLQYTCQS